jgi:nitrilase
MDVDSQYRVAVVQVPPVLLDREATLARAVVKVEEAADAGAKLVAFPEAFVPGYPDWVWRLRPGTDYDASAEIWRRFLPQTVDLEQDELAVLRDAARRRSVTITLGINERDGSFSRATVYNTLVVIGPDGEILLRHRKLVPTNPERMVWGAGDGVGLEAVETPLGRVGGLVCWENYMPLARFALSLGAEASCAPRTFRRTCRSGRTSTRMRTSG